ncbi:MAG: hypothetical protein U9N76_06085 [Candidatus Marinimicrobia bacterium]|nr:hypothetical protein [Candidatus Neomarinimicrobiota bacterium]
MENNFTLIGVDGGATKVSAWEINVDKENTKFTLSDNNVIKKYHDYPSFIDNYKPVDIKIQLDEMSKQINLTEEEKQHGEAYLDAVSDAIIEIAKKSNAKKLLIGIGMPGLKTKDKRGISALANGPRLPQYSDYIEKKLKQNQIELFAPIAHLGSDADYCGFGEEFSVDGKFANVENSYYIGGGTGVADVLKLNGKVVPFDNTKSWLAKTWEMKNTNGISMEKYISASGIQTIYGNYANISFKELTEKEIYTPQIIELALNNDVNAKKTIAEVVKAIALLFFERITTIYFGSQDIFDFVNPNKEKLTANHEYKNTLLESIIVGQRLGDYLEESKGKGVFWESIISELTELFLNFKMTDEKFNNHYMINNKFNEAIIQISKLREAPAIGAGIDAYLNGKWKK